MKHTVTFQPSGARGEIDEGKSLLEAARLIGEPLYAVCGGQGVCGKCRTVLVEGELSPPSTVEHEHLAPEELAEGVRLACEAAPRSSVTVLVPEGSSGARAVALGVDGSLVFPLDPPVKNLYIELNPPSMSDNSADAERVKAALKTVYGLKGVSFSLHALRALHGALKDGGWKLTVSVRYGREVVRIVPGFSPSVLGVSFDVGTTTIAATLCDMSTGEMLASDARTNPLVVMGDDVLSRVSYATSHKGGADGMRKLLLDAINDMIADMVGRAGGDGPARAGDVMEVVVAGNTVMHHTLLGLPLNALGVSPFVPAAARAMEVSASDAGIMINPGAHLFAPPLVGGFIGCDITSVVAAVGPFGDKDTVLVADIGTNGELALFHGGRVSAASCATGPAFEGAQISCGMRASEGAIEKVIVDPDSWDVSYRLVGSDGWSTPGMYAGARGICGSGTLDVVAQMRRAGVLDETGAINTGTPNPRVIMGESGQPEFVVAWPEETRSARPITFTQSDVRAVQLAKAAVAAGIEILMTDMGVARPDRLVVAGAFGNYLDVWSASALGMFPRCSPENAVQAGNAAGDGAMAQLLSTLKREEAAAFASAVRYVELSTHPGFQERFLAEMALP